MKKSWNRRQVLKQLAATSAAAVLPRSAVAKIFLRRARFRARDSNHFHQRAHGSTLCAAGERRQDRHRSFVWFACARVLGPPLRKLQQQATTRFEVVTRVHSSKRDHPESTGTQLGVPMQWALFQGGLKCRPAWKTFSNLRLRAS